MEPSERDVVKLTPEQIEALKDGASALKYRAERLKSMTSDEHYLEKAAEFERNAAILLLLTNEEA